MRVYFCISFSFFFSCILRTIRQALAYSSTATFTQGIFAQPSLARFGQLNTNKKSQHYHSSSFYENNLIGVGLLFNGSFYLRNPCSIFPHQVNISNTNWNKILFSFYIQSKSLDCSFQSFFGIKNKKAEIILFSRNLKKWYRLTL